jgi:hypothetical protein
MTAPDPGGVEVEEVDANVSRGSKFSLHGTIHDEILINL